MHPLELAWALASPFLLVVGATALLLAVGYLSVGADFSGVARHFLLDFSANALPFIGLLVGVWTFYCAGYLLLASKTAGLWLFGRSVARSLLSWGLRLAASPRRQFPCPASGSENRNLLITPRPRFTNHLSVGWVAGVSRQVE